MRIKVFYSHNGDRDFPKWINSEVNSWLEDNQDKIEVVEIKHRMTGSAYLTIMIVYKLK